VKVTIQYQDRIMELRNISYFSFDQSRDVIDSYDAARQRIFTPDRMVTTDFHCSGNACKIWEAPTDVLSNLRAALESVQQRKFLIGG